MTDYTTDYSLGVLRKEEQMALIWHEVYIFCDAIQFFFSDGHFIRISFPDQIKLSYNSRLRVV